MSAVVMTQGTFEFLLLFLEAEIGRRMEIVRQPTRSTGFRQQRRESEYMTAESQSIDAPHYRIPYPSLQSN
jgi:hypothetical protein